MRFGTTIFLMALWLALPISASACPNCKDAVEATSSESNGDDDPLREARAYNRSIYFMVGVPYLLVGTVGAFCYRAYRLSHRPPRV